jgi:hypothetical protein
VRQPLKRKCRNLSLKYTPPNLLHSTIMVVLSIVQLVGLLKDKNPVVRQLALENLLPYTQTGNPHIGVWEANNWEGGRILKVLTRDNNVPPP